MEKGKRGLAEAGSSGEAVGPGEKQETGFTKLGVTLASARSRSRRSEVLELGLSGPSGSAFGTKAGADPEENMKEPALWAGAPAGTTGAGKAAGSGAWDILEVETGGGSRDPSEGQEAADTGLGLKKSRSDDGSFWNRCH